MDIDKNAYKLVVEFMDDLNAVKKLMEEKIKSCCIGNSKKGGDDGKK